MWFETSHLWFNVNVQIQTDNRRIKNQPAKTHRNVSNTTVSYRGENRIFQSAGGWGGKTMGLWHSYV
jgi:hypothetical protein